MIHGPNGLRGSLAGPPLTNDTDLVTLMENGVTVAFGQPEAWAARNSRFDLAWVSYNVIHLPRQC